MKRGREMVRDGFPPVGFVSGDHERPSRLAVGVSRNMPDVSEYLKDELERATVVDDEDIQPTVVTMGTTVTFRDEETQDVRRITLVYPDDADISEGKILVLTTVGVALIGLQAGHSIYWFTLFGKPTVMPVLTPDHLPTRQGREKVLAHHRSSFRYT